MQYRISLDLSTSMRLHSCALKKGARLATLVGDAAGIIGLYFYRLLLIFSIENL